jgi:hypothetical protein
VRADCAKHDDATASNAVAKAAVQRAGQPVAPRRRNIVAISVRPVTDANGLSCALVAA